MGESGVKFCSEEYFKEGDEDEVRESLLKRS